MKNMKIWYRTENSAIMINDASWAGITDTNSVGMWTANRTSNTTRAMFFNTTKYAQTAKNSTTIPNTTIGILKQNAEYSTRQLSLFWAGRGFSDAEQVKVYNCFSWYLTEVGAK